MVNYHDREWGVPVHDDRQHFEFLMLEAAQADQARAQAQAQIAAARFALRWGPLAALPIDARSRPTSGFGAESR